MESSAASSGLDFEDTALTLRLPGSDTDRSSPRAAAASDAPSSPKARVVGWPPVSRNRRNALPRGKFVKVAVAGAPYQRKVDLEAYAGYEQLLAALQDKFIAHFTVRRVGNEEMKLVDVVSGTEYVPTYEDKDGDWMLVGDVPWRLLKGPYSCGNNEHLFDLISQNRQVILPIIYPALIRNACWHWNQSVLNVTMNVRKMFSDMDETAAGLSEQFPRGGTEAGCI